MPAPRSASPPTGSHIAKKIPLEYGASDALVTGLVWTVRVDMPEPPVTEAGLNVHVGGRATTGVMLQERLTLLLKLFCGAIVMVDMAEAPALTDAGVRAEAVMAKSGTGEAGLKLTDCITQLPLVSGAVASQLPAAEVIRCCALSPLG